MPDLFGPGVAGKLATRNQSLQVLGFDEQCINDGNRFYVTGYTTVANGGTVDFSLTTPDSTKWLHFVTDVIVSEAMTINLYEGMTNVSGGTPLVPRNKNRNSANTSDATLLINPSATLGTIIDSLAFGDQGGERAKRSKFILKQNTTYMWRLISGADGNVINYSGEWVEFAMEI